MRQGFIDIDLLTLPAKETDTRMKRQLTALLLPMLALALHAQTDSTAFRAYLYNKEYDVFLRISLYDQDITIPGQELYGQLPGYLSRPHYSFCWVITSAKVEGKSKATLQLINDFGSEDLTATLQRTNDSLYILRQEQGNTIKIPNKGKWQKLPKTLTFKRQK